MKTGIRLAALAAALVVVCAPSVALAQDNAPQVPTYLVEWLGTLLAPILAALGAWLAAEAIRWLRLHVKHTQSREALERAVHAISVAVGEVEQTTVKAIKEASADGKLTKEEANMALKVALSSAKEYLGPKGLATLREVLGQDENAIDRYLVGLIEARVNDALSVGTPLTTIETPPEAKSKGTSVLPTVLLVLFAALPLGLLGCQPPKSASDVERTALVGYALAVEVVEATDNATATWVESLDEPTDGELEVAERIAGALVKARELLVVARERLLDGEEVLDELRDVVAQLRDAVGALDASGVRLPDQVGETLATVSELLGDPL